MTIAHEGDQFSQPRVLTAAPCIITKNAETGQDNALCMAVLKFPLRKTDLLLLGIQILLRLPFLFCSAFMNIIIAAAIFIFFYLAHI